MHSREGIASGGTCTVEKVEMVEKIENVEDGDRCGQYMVSHVVRQG